jgi:hypothetical protein
MRQLILVLLAGCGSSGAMRQTTLGEHGKPSGAAPSAPLAIGTRFYPELAASIDGTTTPNLRLESAVPDILTVDGAALVAKKPGTSAVLITTDDGSVVDFVHVWVSPITAITVTRKDSNNERIAGAIGLAVGEDITLEPALWFGAQRLTGDADVTWTASSDHVTVLRDGSAARRRLRAHSPGKSTITIALGEAKTTVELEVVP